MVAAARVMQEWPLVAPLQTRWLHLWRRRCRSLHQVADLARPLPNQQRRHRRLLTHRLLQQLQRQRPWL